MIEQADRFKLLCAILMFTRGELDRAKDLDPRYPKNENYMMGYCMSDIYKEVELH